MKWQLSSPLQARSVPLLGECLLRSSLPVIRYLHLYRRFVDDAFGFALTWNYWFNDAVSTASDLVALQLLLQYWTDNFPGWALSLIFLAVLIGLNIVSVKVYGEMEYWLSFLKIVTIVVSCRRTTVLNKVELTPFTDLHYSWHRCELWRQHYWRIHRH